MKTQEILELLDDITEGSWLLQSEEYEDEKYNEYYVQSETEWVVNTVARHLSKSDATLISISPDLAKEVVHLRELLSKIAKFIPSYVVECRGDKCRELWCASCNGWDAASEYVNKLNDISSQVSQALRKSK